MKRTKKAVRTLALLPVVLALTGGAAIQAFAETVSASVSGQYYQTTARSMMTYINDFRTNGEGWYWNEDDTTKTYTGKLAALSYDYKLEQVAMKRASEIALNFAHTRPDGTDCFTAYDELGYPTFSYRGENIAVNYVGDAESIFNQWKEEDEPYTYQGHRRSMLSANFKYVGIAFFEVNGFYYCVQEFGDVSGGLSQTNANNSAVTVDVPISSSYVTKAELKTDKTSMTMEYGATSAAPSAHLDLTTKGWSGAHNVVPSDAAVTYTSSDSTGLSVNGSKVTAKKAGSYTLTAKATFNGATYTKPITVTVKKRSLESSAVSAALTTTQYTYDGGAKQPSTVLKYGSQTLYKGTDYTVKYDKNISAGTADVIVTGMGNYEGSLTLHFTINKKPIKELTLTTSPESVTYTGSAVAVAPVLKDGSKTLTEGKDYTFIIEDNLNAGTGHVTVTGKGNYTGTETVDFTINKVNVSKLTVSGISDAVYSGIAVKPVPTVKFGSKTLTEGKDYTLTYKDNVKAGTAGVIITGKGNFTGSRTVSFEIAPKDISKLTVSEPESCTYNGKANKPAVTVSDGRIELTNYTLSYKNNVNAGEGSVTVTCKGNYTGSVTKTFKIKPRSIGEAEISAPADAVYTGSAITPAVNVTDLDSTLTEGVDYELVYKNNVDAGEAAVTVKGKGNYGSSAEKTFEIVPKDISGLEIAAAETVVYTGSTAAPEVAVMDGETALAEDEFTVSCDKNAVDVGTYELTVTVSGNYTGTKTLTYEITPKDISAITVTPPLSVLYTGKPVTSSPVLTDGSYTLAEGEDYTLAYSSNTEIGEAEVEVTCTGNYKGTAKLNFIITDRSLEDCELSADSEFVYDGSSHIPAVTLTYDGEKLGEDEYTVKLAEGDDAVDAGEYILVIGGSGSYAGELTHSFTIKPFDVADCEVVVSDTEFVYDGKKHAPTVKVLRDGEELSADDFDTAVESGADAGSYTVTVTGKGNYTGETSADYSILPADASAAKVTLEFDSADCTGEPIEPAVTVTLDGSELDSSCYDVEYADNTEAGTAKVKVTFKGNYTGTAETEFTIKADVLKPANGDKPSDTDKPADTDKPSDTDKPADTDKPSDTDKPTDTDKPADGAGTVSYNVKLIAGLNGSGQIPLSGLTLKISSADGKESEVTAESDSAALEIPKGAFTLTAEKDGYVPRTYKFGADTPKDILVELHLWGDVSGDNIINITDVSKAAAHIKSVKYIEDEYDRAVIDVNSDGMINVTDLAKMAAEVKGVRPIYSKTEK